MFTLSDNEEEDAAPVPPQLEHTENNFNKDVSSDVDKDDDTIDEGLEGVDVEEKTVQEARPQISACAATEETSAAGGT